MKSTTRQRPDSPGHSPPRHRTAWQRRTQQFPRWAKVLTTVVVVSFAAIGFLRGLGDLRDQWIKQFPTDFTALHERPIHLPQHPVRQLKETVIDERYYYLRHLGNGAEGSAVLYMDTVENQTVAVKTFTNVARNPLSPGLMTNFSQFTTTWPTEIEANLLLYENSLNSYYVPVLDYFILRWEDTWAWCLVTPFIARGTLVNLADFEKHSRVASPVELDQVYRPVFNSLLMGLATLHEAHLCHDDVKNDNVFVETSEHWLLGDLGNLRHSSHSWHFTQSWVRQNQWKDCHLNDLRRALKTYLWFLRSACANPDEFDRQFWEGKVAWSQLYWKFIRNIWEGRIPTAHEIVHADRNVVNEEIGADLSASRHASHLHIPLDEKTERELICTTIPKRLWSRWWWLGFP